MKPRLFAARYAGHCRTCSAPLHPGDQIGYDDDDAIRCADCLRHPDTPPPRPRQW